MHGAKLSLGEVFVVMILVVVVGWRGERGDGEKNGEQQQTGNAFHLIPTSRDRNSSHGY